MEIFYPTSEGPSKNLFRGIVRLSSASDIDTLIYLATMAKVYECGNYFICDDHVVWFEIHVGSSLFVVESLYSLSKLPQQEHYEVFREPSLFQHSFNQKILQRAVPAKRHDDAEVCRREYPT